MMSNLSKLIWWLSTQALLQYEMEYEFHQPDEPYGLSGGLQQYFFL